MEPLRVAVLCSKRAPGLEGLLADEERGTLFEVACVITNRRPPKNLELRRFYDAETARIVASYGADIVLLASYIYVLTSPFLDRFPGRIFNIHDSDLTILDDHGERKYVGLHSTRDAMLAGEPETRATLHFVNEKVDGGRILQLTDGYPVGSLTHWLQREWMMQTAWCPLFKYAIVLASETLLPGNGEKVPEGRMRGTCHAAPHPALRATLSPTSGARDLEEVSA